MNQKKISILRVPRRPGAGQALVQSNDEEALQAEQAALKARASLKEEYESRHQGVNIYATPEPEPQPTPEQRKACINASGLITATSGEEAEETPQRPGRARVTPEWQKQQQQQQGSASRTPWATDDEAPTTITKISSSRVKGITW